MRGLESQPPPHDQGGNTVKTFAIIVLSFLAIVGLVAIAGGGVSPVAQWIDALTMGHNTNPPAYVRDVVAYKEGDGLRLYVTLADAQGALTRSPGTLTIRIRDERHLIYFRQRIVQAEEFQVTQVGVGAFARSTVLLNLGRITEKDLDAPHQTPRLTVEITFERYGNQLTGSTTVWL